jgi:DnaA family protein
MLQMQQRVLALQAPVGMDFSQFIATGNETSLTALRHWIEQGEQSLCFLLGCVGSGRTHLAQALLQEASEQGKTAIYLSAQQIVQHGTGILQGLDQVSFFCIDDVDLLLSQAEALDSLNTLLKRLQDTGGHCLLTTTEEHYSALLNRLLVLSFIALKVVPLSSREEKQKALVKRAEALGIILSKDLLTWLMNYFGEDLAQLTHLINYLAQASWTLKRPITLPFAKKVLLAS